MQPSIYQQKVIEALSGDRNIVVSAAAGSGKTTLLKMLGDRILQMGFKTDRVKIVVFAKQNGIDLKTKFGKRWHRSISTLHSLGFSVLKRELDWVGGEAQVSKFKYQKIGRDLGLLPVRNRYVDREGSLTQSKAVVKVSSFLRLFDLMRLTKADFSLDAVENIVARHNLEGINDYCAVLRAMERLFVGGQEAVFNDKTIDFVDMIHFPVHWELWQNGIFPSFDWLLIDEVQDLNALQLEFSLRLVGDSGRIIGVGDSNQAIFGFAGSDSRSYENIIARTNALVLPLALCYRCPKSHIALVRELFPEIEIEALPGADDGVLESVNSEDLWNSEKGCFLQVGDLLIARKTAPLVNVCIRLIARGIAATVRGRDIGAQIKDELEAIASISGFVYERFPHFCNLYLKHKVAIYEQLPNCEELKSNLFDRLEALDVIYQSQSESKSIEYLCLYIDSLFSDSESPVNLCTCHRAKGLEAERIFILQPGDLPFSYSEIQSWQSQQEANLHYVALTRAKLALYIVGNCSWFDEDLARTFNNSPNNELLAEEIFDEAERFFANLSLKQRTIMLRHLNSKLNEEKRSLVKQALIEHGDFTNKKIAEFYGVSAPFVAKVRRSI